MRGRNAALAGLLFFCHLGSVAAQTGELVDRSELKVCADPNNLPFSDEGKDGFENKIAELIGDELGLKVDYVWFPQVIGFVRNTLRPHLCDLVMGTLIILQPMRCFTGPTRGSSSMACKIRGWRACTSASSPEPRLQIFSPAMI